MDDDKPLTRDDVRAIVASACFPGTCDADRIGLEVELLPVRISGDATIARLPLAGPGPSTVQTVEGVAAAQGPILPGGDADRGFALAAGGRITFEPGGQIEVAPGPSEQVSAAVDGAARICATLAAALDDAGGALAGTGIDVWTARDVAQQLRAPRYPAMDAYFGARGSSDGRLMMRHTASLQISVDAGDPAVTAERWDVANLVAPLATATFACSPADGALSRRARAWQRLDPTRTGIPAGVMRGDDPVTTMSQAALDADVLLVRRGEGAVPGRPGWRFAAWLDDGHPAHGSPTVSDLRYHLTTLFHEVRPRGPLEIRSIDALPARWRAVPAVLYAGLLLDDTARVRVREILEPQRHRLATLLVDGATTGVHDPALCALAVETWSLALAGALRLAHRPDRAHLLAVEAFLDRFTLRGRTPADDLADALRVGPDAALAWAREPLPTHV